MHRFECLYRLDLATEENSGMVLLAINRFPSLLVWEVEFASVRYREMPSCVVFRLYESLERDAFSYSECSSKLCHIQRKRVGSP